MIQRKLLSGLRVVELGGIGPTPFAGMLLADLGADVIAVDRFPQPKEGIVTATTMALAHGKRRLSCDLSLPQGHDLIVKILEQSDICLEGFRPGVAEKLALDPDSILEQFPSLVYGRVTGWGRSGLYADQAGHDINYLGLAGVLEPTGYPNQPPPPPLNLLGDFAAGALFLVVAILGRLVSRAATGNGGVEDVAMIDGLAYLNSMTLGLIEQGAWSDQRCTNFFDGSRPFYATYETSDGGFMAVGCVEDKFYRNFLKALDLGGPKWEREDSSLWRAQKQTLREVFELKSRDHWTSLFSEVDACVTPVLGPIEAMTHSHNAIRPVYAGLASRFGVSSAGGKASKPDQSHHVNTASSYGSDTRQILRQIGCTDEEVQQLCTDEVIDPQHC